MQWFDKIFHLQTPAYMKIWSGFFDKIFSIVQPEMSNKNSITQASKSAYHFNKRNSKVGKNEKKQQVKHYDPPRSPTFNAIKNPFPLMTPD